MNDDAIKIILLPGMDGTGELLECFVERAPQKFEPFVVPLPQKALSSYPELADRVIRHIPINEPFLLLGESFSGPLALEIASRQLTDLMGVILVASFVTPPVSQRLRWLPWSLLFHLPAPRAMIQRLLLNSTEDETLATEVLQTLRSVDPQVLASRVQLVLIHNSRQVLKSCPAPLLSLQASFDRLVSEAASEEILRIQPDAAQVALPAPHLLLQTEPDRAWKVIADWAHQTSKESSQQISKDRRPPRE